MLMERGGTMELESLSSEMFSPLSEREASLVIGGADVYYFESYKLVAAGSVTQFYDDGSSVTTTFEVYQQTDAGVIVVF
ncbi:MAG: hypothetical protein JWM27_2355 [Gemmatimonadetes bacterium]|nr:hypothetical protein [Gemmatimonadota bacterium]